MGLMSKGLNWLGVRSRVICRRSGTRRGLGLKLPESLPRGCAGGREPGGIADPARSRWRALRAPSRPPALPPVAGHGVHGPALVPLTARAPPAVLQMRSSTPRCGAHSCVPPPCKAWVDQLRRSSSWTLLRKNRAPDYGASQHGCKRRSSSAPEGTPEAARRALGGRRPDPSRLSFLNISKSTAGIFCSASRFRLSDENLVTAFHGIVVNLPANT
jgi:hypothetical protein